MENETSQSPAPAPAVTEAQVNGLASVGATPQEISEYLGLPLQQLEAEFGPLLRQRAAWYRITLRRRQFTIATHEKGDLKMLQWLGRFNLNQNAQSPPQSTPESQIKTYIGIDPETI